MQYRKEIDGLRAIAVLPVIFYHSDISGFGGGYIGVDIFFVISGYLITSIILDEKKKNKFSIINFYERRARRILPALTVVLALTTIAAYIFMPASLLTLYSSSLISVVAFASNIYFYKNRGYFSPESDEMPLLHTWSLAVEEQYYLFFPLFIVLLWPLGKKYLAFAVLLTTIGSLLFTQYLLEIRHSIDANFYLIFSRAWELFFGSIIVFFSLQYRGTNQWLRELAGILGLLMIACSILFFNKNTPFPSFYTLIPVAGACLIIIFINSISYVGRILSSKILVFTGLISYSLYLWHQPLFAFLRLKSIGEPSVFMFLGMIICTFILAYLSWQFIEKPFRNKTKFDRTSIFRYSALSFVLFMTVGVVGAYNNGFEQRFNVSSYAASIEHSPKRKKCHANTFNQIKPANACKYFGKNITWAVYGDSHVVELGYALARKLKPYNIGLAHLSYGGCPPALLYEVKLQGCTKWIKESLSYLEDNKEIKNILLGFRHSLHLFGDQINTYPNLPNIDLSESFTDSFRESAHEDSKIIYWRSFKEMITRLQRAGKNIYILYPVPESPIDINKAALPFSIFGDSTVLDLERATSSEFYFNRNKFILGKLDSLRYGKKLHAIKPFEIFCNEKYCPVVKGNNALYYDANHPSLYGAKLIVDSIDLGNKYNQIIYPARTPSQEATMPSRIE